MALLSEAYQDEVAADLFYSEVLAHTQDFAVVDTLIEARRDERDHARKIEEVFNRLFRYKPEVALEKAEYTGIEEALRKALEGELHAISFYEKILESTTNKIVQDTFWEIRQDEIVHAKKIGAVLKQARARNRRGATDPFNRYALSNL